MRGCRSRGKDEDFWGLVPSFIHASNVALYVTYVEVEEKVKLFRSFWWSDSDIGLLFRLQPYCFNKSEGDIRIQLEFRVVWLFSNGMKESEQCHVTLQINATEEASLMELLKFMYSNNLTVTAAYDVLDVLLTAEKFDVASCTRYCGRLLRTLTMTPESVLVYLDLPSTILMTEAFQPLTIATKQFYVVYFKDMTKYDKDEILNLPLAGLEEIIASDDLRLLSENEVYRFVLKWVASQYPKLEDSRKIMMTRLAKFIRYPYMTRRMLTDLLTREEFDPEFAEKVVTEALSFKSAVPNKQHAYISDENSNVNRRFVERPYKVRPIKMVKFQQPRPHCVVYLELKRDICASLFPSGNLISEPFEFGGQEFFLMALHHMDHFEVYLATVHGPCAFPFDYEFAGTDSIHAQEFVSRFKRSYTCEELFSPILLFKIPWTCFMGEDKKVLYFINDRFHLSVELTDKR
ncbi:putative BTB/POZ domain, BTB/Kelch-associated [Helianthus annuus]|uniref:BTB/POZ domain, BTB/Kelch-associated n=2 Tax=Helianthus annuus TaxID=4232 RepID=A0A9K3DUZ5_HELAN|nr:putative BTB/POZ domain, BTB/Kelch-associated [Helianthus annuus]KAJ0439677.1 putative chromatin remodeling & transcription regulator BTB-POZ family [Helianthus annuus]KAJ0642460.1 putative chromatin remodeling & transcription regulator BTB-POZ family [Helianthus annuus]